MIASPLPTLSYQKRSPLLYLPHNFVVPTPSSPYTLLDTPSTSVSSPPQLAQPSLFDEWQQQSQLLGLGFPQIPAGSAFSPMFDATGATPLLSPFEFPVGSIYGQDLSELYASTPIDPTFLMMATPASMISPASLVSPFLFGLDLPAPASLSSTPIPADCGLDADGLLSFNAPAQSPSPPPKSPETPNSSVGSPALSAVELPSFSNAQSKTDGTEDEDEDADAESPRSPLAHKSAASRARGRANHPPEVEEVFVRWLLKHYRHPYPDKHEKQTLMEQTKTEDNQVMHWFDNARRRAVRTKDKKGKNAVWRFVPRWVEKRRRLFPQLAKEFDAVELLQ